ncbi:MAG: serine hydrolase [Thermoanaerobaculia bacterium]
MPLRRATFAAVVFAGAAIAPLAGLEAPPSAVDAALWNALESRIDAAISRLDGVAGLWIEDLASGATISRRADQVFPQASAIKLALLYELGARIDEGDAAWSEPLALAAPRVGGGGILEHLSPDLRLSLRDLAVLMIVDSDNDATNALIDRLGLDRVTRRMHDLGLPSTRLARRMIDLDAARAGRENVSTPREMAALMRAIRDGRGLAPATAAELRAILALPKSGAIGEREPFLEPFPAGPAVLEKAGSLDGVRTAVAAVELAGRPYLVAISTTALARDGEGENLIAEISAALYSTFDRLAREGVAGRLLPR